MGSLLRLTICIVFLGGIDAYCQSDMASIKGGTYIPLYGRDSMQITINDFLMDVYPVTNEEFLAFVIKNPKWKRSQVKKIFADENYLQQWKTDTSLGDTQSLQAPVTNIS